MKQLFTALLTGISLMNVCANGRLSENFNSDWKFHLGDVPDAKTNAYDDQSWQPVRLPHDWSVELSFTQEDAGGCTAFLPGGIGWYRKIFALPASSTGKHVRVEFDGVYNNSDVWINGHHLGNRPYGYAPFSYELADKLNFGGDNTIVVRADRSAYMDCRWYPGSGIYRNVKLVTYDPVHIPQWGVLVTSENDNVTVATDLKNASDSVQILDIKTALLDADGLSVAHDIQAVTIAAGASQRLKQDLKVENPNRWDTENPYLYDAVVTVSEKDQVFDRVTTPFGIRDILYDAEKGFFLNGTNVRLKGVCSHHDGGCVGAAVPDGVWERRLRTLKEGGCNAIRTAHNPPSAEFLDLCDRLGFLVQDEAFDEWDNPKDKRLNFNQTTVDDRTLGYSEHFREWGERDVKAMVLRDRNHPSIIMWSSGNEIEWTYPEYSDASGYWMEENKVDYYWDEPPYSINELKERFAKTEQGEHDLAEAAANLSKWIKEEDTSRPVIANLVIPSISHFSGYADALDIIGYSYRTVNYDWGRKYFPDKMILGTENWVQWDEWKAVLDRPAIPGVFLWTGINYLGESLNWPQRASGSGMLDTAGFTKPNYWFFKTFWNESEPMVYVTTQNLEDSNYLLEKGTLVENPDRPRTRKWGWPTLNTHWNYDANKMIYIEIYSNCEETELFLNEASLGIKKLAAAEDRMLKWAVPFSSGELKAVSRNGGVAMATQRIVTAGKPAAVQLSVDKQVLFADGQDVVHCVAQLVDETGSPVKHAERMIQFSVEGDAFNIGVDNGSQTSTQDFQSDTCQTDNGRCLMIVQAGILENSIKITASSDQLKSGIISINSTKAGK